MVEQVVGDIRDQFDLRKPTPTIEAKDSGGYTVDGRVSLAELNDTLGTHFEGEFDTVGGFVLSWLGRAPEIGDSVEADSYCFRVTDVEGARITSIAISETETESEGTSENTETDS